MDGLLLALMTFLTIALTCQVKSQSSDIELGRSWLYQGLNSDDDDTLLDEDEDSSTKTLYKVQQKLIMKKPIEIPTPVAAVTTIKQDEVVNDLRKDIDAVAIGTLDWKKNAAAVKQLNGAKMKIIKTTNEDGDNINNDLTLDGNMAKVKHGSNLATEEDRKKILTESLVLTDSSEKAQSGDDTDDEDANYSDDEFNVNYYDNDYDEEDEDNDDENHWDEYDDDDDDDNENNIEGDKTKDDNQQSGKSDESKENPIDYIFDDRNKQNNGSNGHRGSGSDDQSESVDIIENEIIDGKNLEPRKKKFFNLEDEEVEYNLNNVKLFIFTKDKPNESVKFYAEPSVENIINCNIDFTGKVVAVSHGFMNSAESDNMILLREELLKIFDVAIFVDWSPYGQFWMYKTSARSTRVFGEIFGSFLSHLNQHKGLRYDQLHMMGYSLGAHVAAFASRQITALSNGMKPKRLTAFDPALPLIADLKGVRMTDAEIVQVIHSNTGFFGQVEKRGHIDFYPNGGNNQPGCGSESTLTMASQTCDHGRAIMLFTLALKDFADGKEHECQLIGYPCDNYNDYLLGKCSKCNKGADEQCRRILHESQPVAGADKLKSLYLVGGVKEALCAPNYHVELEFWPEARPEKLPAEVRQTPFVVKFKTRRGHILKASFDVSLERPMALLVDHGRPTKIKNARIPSKSYHKLIRSIRITYLSHTDSKVIEKYSIILCFYKNSTVRGELFVTNKQKSQENCRQEYQTERHSNVRHTPFYKQARFGLAPAAKVKP